MKNLDNVTKKQESVVEKKSYVVPQMEKYDPVKVVQGSGGCSGYSYTSLYTPTATYYYTYYYYYYY